MRAWHRSLFLCVTAALMFLPPTLADTPPADAKKPGETGMTAEQVLLFNEYVEVLWQLKLRDADPATKPDLDREAFQKKMWTEFLKQSPDEKKAYLHRLP